MNAKPFLSLLLFVLASITVQAQEDTHFSQFYETSILRNPALTGVFESDYKVGAYYRNQWSSVTDPYQTVQMNVEGRIAVSKRSNDFLSFGVLGYYDVAGALQQKISAVYPAINYNKSISEEKNTYLSVGFTAGYLQYSFDPSRATFNNQFQGGAYSAANPTFENIPNPKMGVTDVGGGINVNTCSGISNQVTYVIGMSGYHFTEPVFSYYRTGTVMQGARWNVNGGIIWQVNENVMVQGHANYGVQGPYSEIVAAGLIGWRSNETHAVEGYEIYGGVIYRNADAVAPVVKLKYKNVAVGASYDVNISSLKPASSYRGGIELTGSVIGYIPARSYYKKTVCPRF